jgi:hypothetical protein
MARITALTAPIVTTLAMSRLTAATVVCVSAAVWGASAAHSQSAGAEAYGEVSTAVSQSFQRLIAAVVKVLPAAISVLVAYPSGCMTLPAPGDSPKQQRG